MDVSADEDQFIDPERQVFGSLLRIHFSDLYLRQPADHDAGSPLACLKCLEVLPNQFFGV